MFFLILGLLIPIAQTFAATDPGGYGYSATSERHYSDGAGVNDALIDGANIPVPSLFHYQMVFFDPDEPLWITSPDIDIVPVKIQINLRNGTAKIQGSQGSLSARIQIDHPNMDDAVGYSGPSILRIIPLSDSSYKTIELNLDRAVLPNHSGRKQMVSFGTPDGQTFKARYGNEVIFVIPTDKAPNFIDHTKLKELAVLHRCELALKGS